MTQVQDVLSIIYERVAECWRGVSTSCRTNLDATVASGTIMKAQPKPSNGRMSDAVEVEARGPHNTAHVVCQKAGQRPVGCLLVASPSRSILFRAGSNPAALNLLTKWRNEDAKSGSSPSTLDYEGNSRAGSSPALVTLKAYDPN